MSILSFDQVEAVEKMHNGCILNGGTGVGKSRTALAYYFKEMGGYVDDTEYKPMEDPIDLYIITTAKKRDCLEWEEEMIPFLIESKKLYPKLNIYVDSWNNVKKYIDVEDAFFIFDEQRAIGYGVWAKSFIKIARKNHWIMLTATPGDKWEDYIPVFIANGFYKNKTQFEREHCIKQLIGNKYYDIVKYINTGRLIRLRNNILVPMASKVPAKQNIINIETEFDRSKYKEIMKERWNIYKQEPIDNASELCQCLRRVCNEDQSKQIKLLEIFEEHPRLIIFYNYNYELDILRGLAYGKDVKVAEWNGHKHQPIPDSDRWIYLVQYNSGAEGWNCISTDTMVFFSQNYSFKMMEQARGRINRKNTPFTELYYYNLKSKSKIDLSIDQSLREKKTFHESRFCGW